MKPQNGASPWSFGEAVLLEELELQLVPDCLKDGATLNQGPFPCSPFLRR